jgi:acetylornithine deacetylase/succinyl-diaminopimelate desuccinylase-like protein
MEVDCRLLPDQDRDTFIGELQTIINDPDVTIETLMTFTPAASSTDTELYRLIETQVREQFEGAAVMPGVGAGFTDSHFFRDMGISSYGFTPFLFPLEDIKRVHGNDERISIENIERGTRFMIELLKRFTAT